MKNKKRSGFTRSILDILFSIPNILYLASNIISLLLIEARLAGKSIITILILSVIFSTLLISTWLCALALLFMFFTIHLGPILSMTLLLLINLLLLLVIGLIISKTKNNLTFPITREQCCHLMRRD